MPVPKLEVHRPAVGKPLIATDDNEHIVAVATDEPEVVARLTQRPVLPLNNSAAIAEFILQHQGLV